jgi:putative phosphoesterase
MSKVETHACYFVKTHQPLTVEPKLTTRIGVVADTHCPEFLDELPPRLFEVIAGVDLIVHGGDVGGEETLRRLRQVAPVHAVRGDHDRGLDLPRELRLRVEGVEVAAIHGNRSRLLEEPLTFLGTVTFGLVWLAPGLHRWLRRRLPGADVIVYGHTHAARARHFEGALLFNPGAVYQVDRAAADARLRRRPGWFEWTWLQFIRHRRRHPPPTAGVLTVDGDRVTAVVHRL